MEIAVHDRPLQCDQPERIERGVHLRTPSAVALASVRRSRKAWADTIIRVRALSLSAAQANSLGRMGGRRKVAAASSNDGMADLPCRLTYPRDAVRYPFYVHPGNGTRRA
jgi:hypothetical protein